MRQRHVTLALASLLLFWAAAAAAQDLPIIRTVAGGGPNGLHALDANLMEPRSVAADSAGNIYVAAGTQNLVFKIDASGLLTIVAGGGTAAPGDGGLATDAILSFPAAVTVDASGNLLIVETGSSRIRRVDAVTGVISTVAGTGLRGFTGDGGPATTARLDSPTGIAVDPTGDLVIADNVNRRIRRVDAASGVITTIAGNGLACPSSGLDPCGDGGLATSAQLANALDVAIDGTGNVLIADNGIRRIRRVDGATGIITTIAGSGAMNSSGNGGPAIAAGLGIPDAIALDGDDNLFITDRQTHRIRRVDAASGIITAVAGNGGAGFSGDGGDALAASLRSPIEVTVLDDGSLLIADFENRRIRRVDGPTHVMTTVAGNGFTTFSGDGYPGPSGSLRLPLRLAADAAGNLYIADTENHAIRKLDAATGLLSTVAGTGGGGFGGDGGLATQALLRQPFAVAVDQAGNVIIGDTRFSRVRRVDAATGIIQTIAGTGATCAGLAECLASGPATTIKLGSVRGVATDAAGHVFMGDAGVHVVRRIDAETGTITTVVGVGGTGFAGDGGPATGAKLANPEGVTLDSSGNIFIADRTNVRIRRVDAATGIITTVAGNGVRCSSLPSIPSCGDGGLATNARLEVPLQVAVDAAGNFYIADVNRIRRVSAETGIITTVAGTGAFGFSGDGGPAIDATLSSAGGIALAGGNLYFSDSSNHRVREVALGANRPPVADAGPDRLVNPGQLVTFSAAASSDPDGSIESFSWDFGDGSSATGQEVGHVYTASGQFDVVLTVVDDQGATATDSALVTVNRAPVASAGPDQTYIVGESALLDGSASADADGTIASFAWALGDGSTEHTAVVSHVYGSPGQFTATLTVIDNHGAVGTDSAIISMLTPADAIDLLSATLASFNLQQGLSNSLAAKLRAAGDALDAANAGRRQDVANRLQAFLNEVEATRGKAVTIVQADTLAGLAGRIIAVLQ